jgi:hypothetical protein
MNRPSILFSNLFIFLCSVGVLGQSSTANAPQGSAVSYTSVTQLNALLSQLEAASKTSQADLARLRIEKWKTDSSNKKQMLSQLDSIQRNLQSGLPEIIAQLRATPEDMPATFKLYRNLDALLDVMSGVVESAGAFGSKDEFQSVSNDLDSFEGTRKQLAERMETLSTAKEAEILRLRTDLNAAKAAIPATPPKKIIIDDNEPAKKSVRKKKPATTPSTTAPAKPSAGQAQTPPAAVEPAKPQ